jgi:hypothetical protein
VYGLGEWNCVCKLKPIIIESYTESNESLNITRLRNPIVCSGLFLKQTQAYIYIRLIASGTGILVTDVFYEWSWGQFSSTLCYTCRIGMISYMDMVRLIKFNHIRVGKTNCCKLPVIDHSKGDHSYADVVKFWDKYQNKHIGDHSYACTVAIKRI